MRLGSLLEMKAGMAVAVASVSANTTLTSAHNVVFVDASGASRTITLPTAVGTTRVYTISRTDNSTNTVTIATTSSQTINGAATFTGLIAQYSSVQLVSDGSNWLAFGLTIDPPRSRISRATNQSITSGSNTTLTLATADWNTTPTLLNGTTIIQPNFPGTYRASCHVQWASGVTGYYQARIMRAGVSGTTEAGGSANVGSTGVGAITSCSTDVNVTAAQIGTTSAQFSCNVFQNTGSSVNVTNGYLELTYMGPPS